MASFSRSVSGCKAGGRESVLGTGSGKAPQPPNRRTDSMNAALSHNGTPLVSVVLLNCKRREALKLTLDSVRHQQYANREIIVVDNGSQESLRDLVEACGPGVKLIELRENLGAGGGRNA